MIEAYPLQWPAGCKRTPSWRRGRSRFATRSRTEGGWMRSQSRTMADACEFVLAEIARLNGSEVVISSNIPVRNDGLPRSGAKRPDDTGVAVYWRDRNQPRCMACDQYDRPEDNLYAIGKSIEALRGLTRWGTSEIMERAFQGLALPSPEEACGTPWHEVLQCAADSRPDEIRAAYRKRALEAHPDRGGSESQFREVQQALNVGLEQAGA